MPAIPLLAGTISKLFLNYGCKEVKVTGLERFLERLNGPRGILTRKSNLYTRPEAGVVQRLTDGHCATQSRTTCRCEFGHGWWYDEPSQTGEWLTWLGLCRVDEPFMWGVLPLTTFMDTRTTRWTLGASDMMFNGK